MKILVLGVKEWPPYSISEDKIKKGGGLGKYCGILFNGLPSNIESIIITRCSKDQKHIERFDFGTLYRIKSCGPRKFNILLFNILSFFKAIAIIKNEKIDIIHAHLIVAIFLGFLLGKLYRIPVVGTPHGVVFGGDDTPYRWNYSKLVIIFSKFIEKKIYTKLDSLVIGTEYNLKRLMNYTKAKYPKAIILPTGISLHDNKRKYNFTNRKINILYIGRLWKLKAIDNLILSLKYLSQDDKNKFILNIVGDGQDRKIFQDLVTKNNLQNNVIFHGFVDSTISYYKVADIFVLPSYSEAYSIALLEAMSYGLACIVNKMATPFGSDYVEIMPNNKPEIIAKSIKKFIDNTKLIQKYSLKSLQVIENSEKNFIIDYNNLYCKLIKK